MATQSHQPLPDPGDRHLPRYSQRPLPAYRYVPGVHPHPVRDPGGHSYEPVRVSRPHTPWSPQEWRQLDDWRYGVDLFNRFYFWEAHEAWEGLWATAAAGRPPALLLQGLIQIAAALLKTHMHVVAGARTLSTEGLNKVARAARTQRTLLGLELEDIVERFTEFFAPLDDNRLPVLGSHVPVLR